MISQVPIDLQSIYFSYFDYRELKKLSKDPNYICIAKEEISKRLREVLKGLKDFGKIECRFTQWKEGKISKQCDAFSNLTTQGVQDLFFERFLIEKELSGDCELNALSIFEAALRNKNKYLSKLVFKSAAFNKLDPSIRMNLFYGLIDAPRVPIKITVNPNLSIATELLRNFSHTGVGGELLCMKLFDTAFACKWEKKSRMNLFTSFHACSLIESVFNESIKEPCKKERVSNLFHLLKMSLEIKSNEKYEEYSVVLRDRLDRF
ncbi:MAG: hypothetical protein V4487_07165 [Chlamydiota bacterium]